MKEEVVMFGTFENAPREKDKKETSGSSETYTNVLTISCLCRTATVHILVQLLISQLLCPPTPVW